MAVTIAAPAPLPMEQEPGESPFPPLPDEPAEHQPGQAVASEVSDTSLITPATTEGQLAHEDATGSPSQGRTSLSSAIAWRRSAWRWPTSARFPVYVQRNLRLKTMSLIFFQLALVLGASVAVSQEYETGGHFVVTLMTSQSAFWTMVLMAVIFLLVLYEFQSSYPTNYVLLGISTLVSAALWSFGGHSNVLFPADAYLHQLVLGIMLVGVFVAAVFMHLMSYSKVSPDVLVPGSMFLGWFAGSAAAYIFSLTLGLEAATLLLAVVATFLLFMTAQIDVGTRLAVADPDSWLRIIISLDAALLMVVSIPFILLISVVTRQCRRATLNETTEVDERAGQAGS